MYVYIYVCMHVTEMLSLTKSAAERCHLSYLISRKFRVRFQPTGELYPFMFYMDFRSPFRQLLGYSIKVHRALPHIFQFIIVK
jgi:hypothetical protein